MLSSLKAHQSESGLPAMTAAAAAAAFAIAPTTKKPSGWTQNCRPQQMLYSNLMEGSNAEKFLHQGICKKALLETP